MNGQVRRSVAGVIIVWSLVIISGCGTTEDPLNRQGVSGKVTFNGQPLANGTVEFQTEGKGVGSGAVIEQGEFVIPDAKGLPPGEYIVRVSASGDKEETLEAAGESDELAKELIPPEYNTESNVRFTVKEGEENVLDLNIPGTSGAASTE